MTVFPCDCRIDESAESLLVSPPVISKIFEANSGDGDEARSAVRRRAEDAGVHGSILDRVS